MSAHVGDELKVEAEVESKKQEIEERKVAEQAELLPSLF